MIVELSPKKIIGGAFTCWNQPEPGVDLVVDLKNLTFKENSIDELYTFHILDHLFENEINIAIKSWKKCLKPGAHLFIIVDNFEYLARSFIGGDMSIDELNADFTHPTDITRENLLRYFREAGFNEDSVIEWSKGIINDKNEMILKKEDYEIIFSSKKNE